MKWKRECNKRVKRRKCSISISVDTMSSLHNGNSLSSLHHGAVSVTQKPHPAVINQVWFELSKVAR